ncbi:hypothetical protein CAEBREN_13487 [Caenorhabditis brenneri]|uniref:BTB domain-containing protein n=1 Tax=Caenorhabditis brenneri TaxID=135651 RepID=G0MUX1_CAEBE|nr:hypothetical protein CAEBREN_13487 [Caenorhabditis brenneri]
MSSPPTKRFKIYFNDPDPNLHDVVFIVGQDRFYCTKTTLARHSEHFYNLFFNTPAKANKKEFVLTEPESSEVFNAFLQLIHACSALNDENVTGVLALSKLWRVTVGIDECRDFLKRYSKKTTKELFDIAVEYGFEDLKKKAISNAKTNDDLYSVVPANAMDLDHATMALVFQRNLELQGLREGEYGFIVCRHKARKEERKRCRDADHQRVLERHEEIFNERNRLFDPFEIEEDFIN